MGALSGWTARHGVLIQSDEIVELVDVAHAFDVLVTGVGVTEGPVWHPGERHLLFTDLPGDVIRVLDDDGVSEFRQPTNMSNGLTLDAALRLIACEHSTSRVTRTDHDGSVSVLASHYGGRELNSPNDVIVGSSGDVYFTDPPYGRSGRIGIERPQDIDFQGVFRLSAATGELQLLADDFDRPNGLCLSPDGRSLYVNDTARMHIRLLTFSDDDRIDDDRVFFTEDGTGLIQDGVPDGMKIDARGNVYCTGPGGIWVISPAGKHLGTILTPFRPTNFAWGGDDLRDLYVTGQGAVCRGRTRVPGFRVPHLTAEVVDAA